MGTSGHMKGKNRSCPSAVAYDSKVSGQLSINEGSNRLGDSKVVVDR